VIPAAAKPETAAATTGSCGRYDEGDLALRLEEGDEEGKSDVRDSSGEERMRGTSSEWEADDLSLVLAPLGGRSTIAIIREDIRVHNNA
jgi:hypothetical protein